jgi:hypothetical protein
MAAGLGHGLGERRRVGAADRARGNRDRDVRIPRGGVVADPSGSGYDWRRRTGQRDGVPVVVMMVPVVVMEPGSYPTSSAGMVSAGVPPPVVQSLEEATLVQLAVSRARSSVTVTAPSAPEMVVPGVRPVRTSRLTLRPEPSAMPATAATARMENAD